MLAGLHLNGEYRLSRIRLIRFALVQSDIACAEMRAYFLVVLVAIKRCFGCLKSSIQPRRLSLTAHSQSMFN